MQGTIPDTFRTSRPASSRDQTETHETYLIRITDRNTDARAVRLKDAIAAVESAVDSSPGYRQLPPAKEE